MTPKYILSSFTLEPEANPFLDVSCRPGGFINWILCKLRFQDSARLTINRQCLDFKSKSIKQFDNISVPISRVMSVSYGADKPYWHLVACIALLLLAVALPFFLPWWSLFFPLFIALCFALSYYTGQSFYLKLEHGDDKVFCIHFRPSIIERVSVNMEQVDQACELIRQAMLDSQTTV